MNLHEQKKFKSHLSKKAYEKGLSQGKRTAFHYLVCEYIKHINLYEKGEITENPLISGISFSYREEGRKHKISKNTTKYRMEGIEREGFINIISLKNRRPKIHKINEDLLPIYQPKVLSQKNAKSLDSKRVFFSPGRSKFDHNISNINSNITCYKKTIEKNNRNTAVKNFSDFKVNEKLSKGKKGFKHFKQWTIDLAKKLKNHNVPKQINLSCFIKKNKNTPLEELKKGMCEQIFSRFFPLFHNEKYKLQSEQNWREAITWVDNFLCVRGYNFENDMKRFKEVLATFEKINRYVCKKRKKDPSYFLLNPATYFSDKNEKVTFKNYFFNKIEEKNDLPRVREKQLKIYKKALEIKRTGALSLHQLRRETVNQIWDSLSDNQRKKFLNKDSFLFVKYMRKVRGVYSKNVGVDPLKKEMSLIRKREKNEVNQSTYEQRLWLLFSDDEKEHMCGFDEKGSRWQRYLYSLNKIAKKRGIIKADNTKLNSFEKPTVRKEINFHPELNDIMSKLFRKQNESSQENNIRNEILRLEMKLANEKKSSVKREINIKLKQLIEQYPKASISWELEK